MDFNDQIVYSLYLISPHEILSCLQGTCRCMSCRSQHETWPSLTSLSGDLDTLASWVHFGIVGPRPGCSKQQTHGSFGIPWHWHSVFSPSGNQTGLPEPTLALERKAGLAFQWSQVISLTSFMYSVFSYFLCMWCLRSMSVNLPWMVWASQKSPAFWNCLLSGSLQGTIDLAVWKVNKHQCHEVTHVTESPNSLQSSWNKSSHFRRVVCFQYVQTQWNF